MWAATSISNVEAQFGLVYGFAAQPTSVTQSRLRCLPVQVTNSSGVSTLYDILYAAGTNANMVKVDVPSLLPTFTQAAPFNFVASYPLTFETGGYNAFTTSIVETAVPSESFAGSLEDSCRLHRQPARQPARHAGRLQLEFWHSLPSSPAEAYHPFTYTASTTKPLVYYVDVDFENGSEHLSSDQQHRHAGRDHAARLLLRLAPLRPHLLAALHDPLQGRRLRGQAGSNYDFNRDFSIAMTFSASDVNTTQGLLYKGTGSDNTSPELDMSYRVGISDGTVTLQLFDGSGNESPLFLGPTIQANQYYQVIIVKNTTTPTGNGGSTDPYAPPLDPSEMGNAASSGMNLTSSGFPSGGGAIKISGISPADSGSTLSTLINNLSNSSSSSQSYNVTISVRTVNADGTPGSWNPVVTPNSVGSNKAALTVNSTGSAHLLIGSAYDDSGQAIPLGGTSGVGNIRDVYLFSSAINAKASTRTPASSTSPTPLKRSSTPPASWATGSLHTIPTESSTTRSIPTLSPSPPTPPTPTSRPWPATSSRAPPSTSTATPCRSHSSPAATSLPRCSRLHRRLFLAQLQRRLLQAAGDQHLDHDPAALPGHR